MPIEEQLLPNKQLKPYYDKVIWLYVCRTFKDTPKDREALRTHDRFGISSWPHQYLFDPKDDRILATMPRKLPGFMASMDKVLKAWKAPVAKAATGKKLASKLALARATFQKGDKRKAIAMVEPLSKQPDRFEAWLEARELLRTWRPGQDKRKLNQRLADPDPRERAIVLEELASGSEGKPATIDHAQRLLTEDNEDIVVRVRALRYLAKASPGRVTKVAEGLLALPNDPFRYEVLALIQKQPDPNLEPTLVRLFRGAGTKDYPSRNPNVVRIRAAECLAECGGAAAIEALAEPARECNPYNGLTKTVFRALASIGARTDKTNRKKILAVLLDSLPQPCDVTDQDSKTAARTLRRYLYLVGEILKSIQQVSSNKQLPRVPKTWTAKDRDQLHKQLRRITK
ncbi:MAG: hypothetical protein V3U11_13405 [Planctomycetota bacterium]